VIRVKPCTCKGPSGFTFHSSTETTQTWIHDKCGGYVEMPFIRRKALEQDRQQKK